MSSLLVRRAFLLCTLALGLGASSARADFIGSYGVNTNLPVIMPVNSLAAATSFTFNSFASNGITSGCFNGMIICTLFYSDPTNTSTPITLTLGSSTSGFTFSNATYGTFTQTAAAVMISQGFNGSTLTSESFRILGTYTGAPGMTGSLTSSVTISFTQTGGPGTSVSASGTVNVPAAVPEPASLAMLGLGLVTVGGLARRRRAQQSN